MSVFGCLCHVSGNLNEWSYASSTRMLQDCSDELYTANESDNQPIGSLEATAGAVQPPEWKAATRGEDRWPGALLP